MPTPRAIDGRSKGNGPRPDTLTGCLTYGPDGERHNLPTPNATDWKGGNIAVGRTRGNGRVRTAGDADLPDAIAMLPTPAAGNPNDGESLESWEARRQRNLDKGINGNGQGTPLGIAARQLLVTPTAQLAVNGGSQSPAKRKAGGHGPTLADQVEHELLPTPQVADVTGGHKHRSGARSGELLLPGVVQSLGSVVDWGRYSRAILRWQQVMARMVPHPLEPGSKGNAVLAPLLVEWMMGLPEGHVTDVPGLSRNAKLKILGNGVVPQQAYFAVCLLLRRVPWNATS